MMLIVSLLPMSADELPAWHVKQNEAYVAERMAEGETARQAEDAASSSAARYFPNGKPLDGHLVLNVMASDDTVTNDITANNTAAGAPTTYSVGSIWIGPRDIEAPEHWWVWGVDIDDTQRGNGFGRRAMELAEGLARNHGATTLGLNVFGHNTVARSLYESLGYEPTAINMRKPL